ncbi:MAG: DMT family transporter [Candidatus Heimdallarchaeota archaeon]|nr:DMT family transporter [Candidatus Heimdallarchaeota archaeon]
MAVSLVVVFSLSAALTWGISDFSGGVASKKLNVLYVLTLSQIIGLLSLLIIIGVTHETYERINLIWPILGGLFGGIGLISLYRGLAVGKMSIVAPVSAMISTSIPIIYSIFTEGLPEKIQILGFITAIVAIILFSLNSKESFDADVPDFGEHTNLIYGVSAGVGFGLFFILLDQFETGSVYWPLSMLRISSIIVFIIIILMTKPQIRVKQSKIHPSKIWITIIIAGIGDTLGNIFFTFGVQRGRLDIAAVISSLFPLTTIFLAWVFYQESILRHQKIGIILALGSVVLFSI